MTRPLNVMIVTSADNWRGSGVSLSKLALGLTARGHRAEVAVSNARVAAEYTERGVVVHELALRRTGIREVLALLALARKLDSEIVIVDKPRDLRLAAWMAMLRDIRIVVRYNRVGARKAERFVDRWSARRAHATLYQSDYIRTKALTEMPALAKVPAFVVHNGYDAAAIAASASPRETWRAAHGIPAGEFVVVSAGFAETEKCFDHTVEALRLLKLRGISATLVFCGDGPCRQALEEGARAAGVDAVWLGLQSQSETLSAIAAADALVHPSPVEIFGNVLAEAMMLHTPVIAVRAGGNVEMLGDDGSAAILVKAGEPQLFASAIAELYAHPSRATAIAAAAHARVLTHFPISRMIDGYEGMMRQLVGSAASVQ